MPGRDRSGRAGVDWCRGDSPGRRPAARGSLDQRDGRCRHGAKGQDGRRYVYLGPRLDAPPMDVFEGAILFDEPGVKAVEFTQRAHGLAHFPPRHLGSRRPAGAAGTTRARDPSSAPLAGLHHSGARSAAAAGCRVVRGQLGRLSLLLARGRADLSLHRSRNRIMSRCVSRSFWSCCSRTTSAAQGTVVASGARAGRRARRPAGRAAPVPRYTEHHRCCGRPASTGLPSGVRRVLALPRPGHAPRPVAVRRGTPAGRAEGRAQPPKRPASSDMRRAGLRCWPGSWIGSRGPWTDAKRTSPR